MQQMGVIEYGIIIMQQGNTIEIQKQGRRPFNLFTYHKAINSWDDFRKTFNNVKFDSTLNHATPEELHAFWITHLKALSVENQKITILVPARVSNADDPKEPKPTTTKKGKGKDQKPSNDVPLEGRVIECAIELIKGEFPSLDYDYASLFLGNDKQLVIFRRCFNIEKYIQKYRLPKNFEKPFEEVMELSKGYFEIKIKRNKAFSTFNKKELQRTSKLAQVQEERLKDSLTRFQPLLASVLQDYRLKPRCRELILNNVPQKLIDLLKPICTENKVVITNRFNDCENDEFKDVVIMKEEDSRLKVYQSSYQEQQKIKYIYVEPPKVPQPPKDLRDMSFLKLDIAKQCYKYRFELPSSGKENPLRGIFIRSQTGSGDSYELSVDIQPGCKEVDVDIYPYKEGKSVYEIYLWNEHGFTKSTEGIVLFNELVLPNTNTARKVKNKNIHLLGESEAGLLPDSKSTTQFAKFSYQQREYFAKDISLGNAAVICDAYGDVAGWGEMFVAGQEERKQDEPVTVDNIEANLRIETPCLLLSGRQIRKVSCGMGYFLMLSTFGSMFSTGINQFGQLGQGDFKMGDDNMNPKEICKFTNTTSPFITDIQATISGASFATCEGGQLYRWGFNQVDETTTPIYDRFNSIINYTTSPIFYRCCNPTKVGKSFIQGGVRQVQGGSSFYFARNEEGVLYGWGECKYLGVSPLLDKQEKEVEDIVNPIQVMKNIQYITVGLNHTIAITKDHRVLGWGSSSAFTKRKDNFCQTPIQLTDEYGGHQSIKLIKAGPNFTALVTRQNKVRIIGECKSLRQEYDPKVDITELTCSYQEFIAILSN